MRISDWSSTCALPISASKNVFVPIIMVTAQSEEWKVMKARDAGVTEFLVKPFSAKTMARRITVVVENPRQFVRTDEFFGPDRRRHVISNYTGQERRKELMAKDRKSTRLNSSH